MKYMRNNFWNEHPKCKLQQHRNISTSGSEYMIYILMMVRLNNMNHKTRFGDMKQNNYSVLYDQYIYSHVYRKYGRNYFWNINSISRLQLNRNVGTSGS